MYHSAMRKKSTFEKRKHLDKAKRIQTFFTYKYFNNFLFNLFFILIFLGDESMGGMIKMCCPKEKTFFVLVWMGAVLWRKRQKCLKKKK